MRTLIPPSRLRFSPRPRFEAGSVLPYVASQCAGAFVASVVLRFLFPQSPTLGATVPAGSAMQSFVLEIILTALLMFVILSVSTGAREKGITAGIAVAPGMFGPSLASMNPARSLAPAVGFRR